MILPFDLSEQDTNTTFNRQNCPYTALQRRLIMKRPIIINTKALQ